MPRLTLSSALTAGVYATSLVGVLLLLDAHEGLGVVSICLCFALRMIELRRAAAA